jgi:pimeloyl-ACP methyl ester carboxylesterase
MHGIRDEGYWTHKLARQVKRLASEQGDLDQWATDTSSYGYFPMLPFLLSSYRRKNVEWLMDQYTEAIARYPNAKVSYIGHSNGTYLLAKALEVYPCCRFDKVVFAGSVVNRRYRWRQFINARPPRVGAVLNFVATRDWVVAFFPKLFQFFGRHDLGSAGHDGFKLTERPSPNFYQLTYVKGGHGAALDEDVWKTIASFIINGVADTDDFVHKSKRRNWLVWLVGKFPPVVWLALLGLVVTIWVGLCYTLGTLVTDPNSRSFFLGFTLAVYMLTLWLVLTRI